MRLVRSILAMLCLSACGGGGGSGGGGEPSFAGTWSGTASDSSGSGNLTWNLEQVGQDVSGNVGFASSGGSVTGNGSLSGTATGTTMTFQMILNFDPPYAGCVATANGVVSLEGDVVTGTFSGSNSCSGPFTGGQLTLYR